MMVAPQKFNSFSLGYEAKSTRIGIKEKLTALLTIIAKNDSCPQRPVLKRSSGFCSAMGRFMAKRTDFPLDNFYI
ncbi:MULTISPECIES: hypothetical protein [unclassified Pseudomonas]|uniref:hypothetical protein n=1 Tax=unclassified Pseudomonas TaxID=196821 RepID=UPI0025DA40E6|nr:MULTISPECIES: hypothetical protein [unclassified Pseudomonas]